MTWQYPGHTHAGDSHNMYSQQGCGSDVIGITMDSRAMSGGSFTLHVYIVYQWRIQHRAYPAYAPPPLIGGNIAFSCIFWYKVKLTPLFSVFSQDVAYAPSFCTFWIRHCIYSSGTESSPLRPSYIARSYIARSYIHVARSYTART